MEASYRQTEIGGCDRSNRRCYAALSMTSLGVHTKNLCGIAVGLSGVRNVRAAGPSSLTAQVRHPGTEAHTQQGGHGGYLGSWLHSVPEGSRRRSPKQDPGEGSSLLFRMYFHISYTPALQQAGIRSHPRMAGSQWIVDSAEPSRSAIAATRRACPAVQSAFGGRFPGFSTYRL